MEMIWIRMSAFLRAYYVFGFPDSLNWLTWSLLDQQKIRISHVEPLQSRAARRSSHRHIAPSAHIALILQKPNSRQWKLWHQFNKLFVQTTGFLTVLWRTLWCHPDNGAPGSPPSAPLRRCSTVKALWWRPTVLIAPWQWYHSGAF